MSKVVYNECYGGFGLSDAAMRRYAELKGIELYPETKHGITFYYTAPGSGSDRPYLYARDLRRDDPALVQVVEELGKAAADEYAKLGTADLPSGTRYRIDEYDGMESVMTPDDYDWQIAGDQP